MLVVEDGTGKSDANSYAAVADADDYFTTRGNAEWLAMVQADKETALVRGTDYMSNYSWKGVRTSATQALDWPRTYVQVDNLQYDTNEIPIQIRNACIELAIRAKNGPLQPDMNPGTTDGRFATKTVEKVGPIDTETTYASRGQVSLPQTPVWTQVNAIVRPFCRTSGGVYR